MPVPVYLPLVLGLALAVAAPRVVRSLPPPIAVWSLTLAAIVSASTWIASLGLIMSTAIDRTAFVAAHGHYSLAHWRHVDPVAVPAAIAAGVTLATCYLLLAIAMLREALAVREVRQLGRSLRDDGTVVFVEDSTPHAYAVGGRWPRIVVSSGLLRTLGAEERRAVLAHESAHLRCRHHAHLRVLRLAAAVNPFLRPAVRASVLAVERWADEEAAVRLGDRTLVARTLVRAALASNRTPTPSGALAYTAGDVSRRVAALLAAPPRPRWSIVAASAIVIVGVVASPVYAADQIGALLSAPCPTTSSAH
ncbi:MAG TPA: M56 family metallopeptidase [Micromonosporaceae bacterium]|nr:M56 family metallopeptidase [Micromonosporaceae bacterium]